MGSVISSGPQVLGRDAPPTVAEIQQQADKVAASAGFKNSDPIRQVLLFLARQAMDGPGHNIKEHEIATSALGRPPEFDPRVDSTVRVIAARLRSKLAEYYIHEGIQDPILIDLPKGGYQLSFSFRPKESLPSVPSATASQIIASAVDARKDLRRLQLAALVAIFVAAAGAFFAGRTSAKPKQAVALAGFWTAFLRSGEPLIVFSNPIFQGTPEAGMHLLYPSASAADGTNDTFTGTGEVMAVHTLTDELASFGRHVNVKRARLFTWDEALANNIIIVGGPAQSSVFLQLPQLQKFVLKAPTEHPFPGQEAVRNVKPVKEPAYYLPDRHAGSGVEYSIVALTPGASSDRSILIIAGTNTFATEAAGRFVCSPTLLKKLLDRLNVRPPYNSIPPFEALLQVEVRGGAPLEAQPLVVYRRH